MLPPLALGRAAQLLEGRAHLPHTGDDPDDGCATVCGQDGTPPWLSWPLLSLPS
jgi:hypothetical protein